MGDDELAANSSFEAWRLVLVSRLILNTIAIVLNLLNCMLLTKLYKKRKAHTSVLTLLYLSYAELTFTLSSQLFSVLFLASHTAEDHDKTIPPDHNKFFVLVALASFGSLKHSSLFMRQWWVVSLLALHCITKHFQRLSHRLAGRRFVRNLYMVFTLVGASFGLVRLIAEKIPEYFRKDYIRHEHHEVIHRVLYTMEFGVPPLLAVPCVAALAALVFTRLRHRQEASASPCVDEDEAAPAMSAALESQHHHHQQHQQQQQYGGTLQLQQQQQQEQLTWSWRSSQMMLIIGLLFVVCQGPLILLDRVGAESPLFINLQDLVISLFSCSYFVVFCATSAAFRTKLIVMCTCTVTAGTAAQDTTVLDSCCEMVPTHRV